MVLAGTGKPVQNSVWYCPDKRFHAFDICVDGQFLSVDTANATFASAGVPFMPVVKSGSRQEVLEWAHEHRADDVQPAWFGDTTALPVIPGNACEGWVVRPVVDAYDPPGCRVILKVKNPLFAEGVGADLPCEKTENDATVAALARVTAARVANVLGKELEASLTMRNFTTLLRLVREDVMADGEEDDAAAVRAKAVNDAAAPLIRAFVVGA